MIELLQALFASQGFEPHGYCFLWTRPLLWLYIISDSLIALSYYSIPIALIYFVRKRRDIAFNWAFLMFAVFIIACGTTHVMALWTLWNPLYWLDGAVKAVTASASLAAAIALWPLIPKALALPSPAQLEAANVTLQGEILERTQAQEALRRAHDELEIRVHERTRELARTAEALQAEIAERRLAEDRLRLQGAALEAAANAVVIADREGQITWANPAFTRLTGYAVEEVLGGNPRILKSGRHEGSFYRELWETILAGRVWHAEMINRRKDGALYFEEQTITPVRDERGHITHFIAIKQDVTERKRAEEALQESEERYRDLVENSEDLICTHDLEGGFLSVNRAVVRRLGYEHTGDILGRKITEFLAPDSRHLFASYIETLVKEGRAHGFMKILTRSGEERIIEYQNSIRSQGVEKPIVRSISHDVTERVRAEAALRRAEKRYRDLVENANDIIYTYDLEGNFTSINRAGETITGYTRHETPAMNLAQVIAPEYLDLSRRMLGVKLREGGPTTYELEIIAKDGRRVPLEVSNLLIYEGGRPVGVQGIARDITERKQTEKTRRALYQASLQIQEPLALRERLDRLLQTAHEILHLDRVNILLSDPEGRWLQAVACLGVEEPAESIRIPVGPEGGALVHAFRTQQAVIWDGRNPLPASLRLQPPFDQIAALRSRAFVIVPLVVQGNAIGVLGADRKHSRQPLDGAMMELLRLFAAQAALAIEHGRLYEAQHMAAMQLGATVEARTRELQASNEQLQEATHQAQAASRHKSAFLANMSHELRTPLNAILGFSELLAQQTYGPLTQKQARYVDNVHTSGQHLLALINDLLDLSKIEAGKLELHPKAFHLREALEAALHVLRPQAEAKQQALRLQVADDVSTLTADPLRVRQILYNLLSNAVKFTLEGGSITVTARQVHSSQLTVDRPRTSDRELSTVDRKPSGDYVEIAVGDTGIGITSEDLPKLFQPFTQLEQTLTKQAQGTGLGLALTKYLVELHGGTIWAESAGEGRGSTFTVRLPLQPPAS